MYIIWFKEKLGAEEISVNCPNIETAQKVYDDLLNCGYYMMCNRP